MNRESKRMTEGQMDADDFVPAPPAPGRRQPTAKRRTSVPEFLREVRDEMRQVAWPTRSELINYTAVVLTTLILMILLIFVLNLAFGKAITFLFQK